MAGRRIIIGDIHGCLRPLESIIESSGYRIGMDEIVFTGDLFDRGTENAEVYRYVRGLREKDQDRVSIVYGNHEDMLIHSYGSDSDMELWEYNGGGYTKESFSRAGIDVTDVAAWIRENTVPFYECPEFYVCHGGTAAERPDNESVYDLVWNREAFYAGNRHSKLMVVGHTPVYQAVWKCRPNAAVYEYDAEYGLPEKGILNIDTGCVFGGKLTAMIAEGNSFRLVREAGNPERNL